MRFANFTREILNGIHKKRRPPQNGQGLKMLLKTSFLRNFLPGQAAHEN
jgi:hypothetical protein